MRIGISIKNIIVSKKDINLLSIFREGFEDFEILF